MPMIEPPPMTHKPLPLTEEERLKLEEIVRKGKDWRSRERADTLLRLARGDSSKEVAEAQGVCTQTVYERRQQWLSKGFAGLLDAPRSGAPGKLSAYLSTIEEWAQASPMSAGEMHQRLVDEFEVTVHLNTVKNALKRLGFVWKRTRYSLKKP
jgi:transposase